MVAELRQAAADNPAYPPILFVFQGSVAQGRVYFSERWPEARAIADPRRRLYDAFGIQRGSVNKVLGFGAIRASTQAVLNGHAPRVPVGDPWLMPGLFLIHNDTIVWQHRFKHIGDHPDFEVLKDVASGLAVPV